MKNSIKLIALILLTFAFHSCSDDDTNTPEIVITSNETTVELGESFAFTVTDNDGQNVTSSSSIYANDELIESNVFTPTEAGTYEVYATHNGATSSVITITVTAPEPQYTPYTVGNYWNYDVVTSLSPTETSRDSLYIAGTEMINSLEYFDFDASISSTGMATSLYSENFHRKNESDYLAFGEINLGALLGDIVDYTIALEDVVLLNDTAEEGTILAEQSGSFSQTVEEIPLTISYTLENRLNGRLDNLEVNDVDFEDIIETRIALNLTITASVDVLGVPITVAVLQPQNVLVMENSYANNIGLIQSDVIISYQLEDLPTTVTLPIPTSSSETIVQKITSYSVE